MAKVLDSAEYHAGYRSCLASVSHYLLTSDTDRDSRFTMLTHLTSGPHHRRVHDFSTAESAPAPILAPTRTPQRSHRPNVSCKTEASYPNVHQTPDRNDCFMPKRSEICDMDKQSFDAQVETSGSKKLKIMHFSLKNAKVDECCILKHNYWRPW